MKHAFICGLEQEYAILVENSRKYDPIQASYLVVNSFERAAETVWDYGRETPFLDARGFSFDDSTIHISRSDNLRINNLLTNGARFYVDHAHPEFSTAECRSVLDLIAFDRAGERVLEIAARRASDQLEGDQRILIFKNNTDHKGNSYGCHENYCLSAALYQRMFPDNTNKTREVFGVLMPFFVTRQLFTGAGKVGSENSNDPIDFQITQRADFFETTIGANTTSNRPIVNTRDEPHADRDTWRRLHVIVGDANMCEVASLLKIGTMRLVLAMMEEELLDFDLSFSDPVTSLKKVSRDFTRKLHMQRHKPMTALEIQREFYQAARDFCARDENDTEENRLVMRYWGEVLDALERDPLELDGYLDWVTKLRLLKRQKDRHNIGWNSSRLIRTDIAYHDIDQERGLYYLLQSKGRIHRILKGEERVKQFISSPPEDTRAWFRGQCLRKFGSDVFEANWDVLKIRKDEKEYISIPLPDPARGTREMLERIMNEAETVTGLVEKLQA